MRPIAYVLVASLALAGIVRLSKAAPEAEVGAGVPAPPAAPARATSLAQSTTPFPQADPPVSTTRPANAEQQPMLHVVRHKRYRVPGTGPEDIAKQKAAQAEKAKAAEKAKSAKGKGKGKGKHAVATKPKR